MPKSKPKNASADEKSKKRQYFDPLWTPPEVVKPRVCRRLRFEETPEVIPDTGMFPIDLDPPVPRAIRMRHVEKENEEGVHLVCCECGKVADFLDMDDAYCNGWYANDCVYYCADHADEAIRIEDTIYEALKDKKK